jgi:hypothetical protein
MRKLVALCLIGFSLIGIVAFFTPKEAKAYYRVNGYFRSNGTYVSPYYRSNPNAFRWDNYSYRSFQPLYNRSYTSPTRNYSSNWYTPDYSYTWNSNRSNSYSTSYTRPWYSRLWSWW